MFSNFTERQINKNLYKKKKSSNAAFNHTAGGEMKHTQKRIGKKLQYEKEIAKKKTKEISYQFTKLF